MAIYSEFFPLKIVIFHSYVSLPEGMRRSIFSVYVRQRGGSPEVAQSCYFLSQLWGAFFWYGNDQDRSFDNSMGLLSGKLT